METLKRIASNRLWDVAFLALAVTCLVRLAFALPERAHRIDLAHYYTSSRLLVQTGHPYGVSLDPLYRQYGFDVPEDIHEATNPPALIWLFVPFAMLPPVWAFVTWALVQTLALGVIFWQIKCLLGERLSDRAWRLLFFGTLASHALYWHYCMSQTQFLLAALVLTGFAWHKEGKHTPACLAVTAAGLLKLFPLILLPWFFWRGRWKSAVAAGIFGAAVIAATGVGHWREFLRTAYPHIQTYALDESYNYTLPSLVLNLVHVGAKPGSVQATIAWRGAWVAGLLLIGAAYLACRQERRDEEVEFSLLSVAMLAGSLVAWGHYLVFLIFPIAVWITRMKNCTSLKTVIFSALALALLNVGPQRNPFLLAHPYLNVLVNWIPLYGLLIMGIALARELKSPNTSEIL
jgi:hypothetical protein